MEYAKFILTGRDKKMLSQIKNVLSMSGHIFVGYSSEPSGILRHVRSLQPDLVIMEPLGSFNEMRQTVEILDEELLSACILLLDSRNDEIFDFLRKTRVSTYIAKPVNEEVLLQITDISLANLARIRDYEAKVRMLNDTLESRKIIEKAKWLLVGQDGITEAEAYDVIRKKSRDHRISMREIAEAILLTRGGTD